jgi:hypothetical protein
VEESYENEKLKYLLQSLVEGNIEEFQLILKDFVVSTLSYFDTKGNEPEAVYLGFIAGMLLNLEPEYKVKTNRESGFGRYDVMVKPVDRKKKAIILELKSLQKTLHKDPEKATIEALKQIEEKGYAKELEAEGYKDIMKLAVVSDGKEVWVRLF